MPELMGSSSMGAGSPPVVEVKPPVHLQLKVVDSIRKRDGAWSREIMEDIVMSCADVSQEDVSQTLAHMGKAKTITKDNRGKWTLSGPDPQAMDPVPGQESAGETQPAQPEPVPPTRSEAPRQLIGDWGVGHLRAARVRRARIALGVTQQQVGMLADPSITRGNAQNIVSRLESGGSLSEDVAQKILLALEHQMIDRGLQHPLTGKPWPVTDGAVHVASPVTERVGTGGDRGKTVPPQASKPTTAKPSRKIRSMASKTSDSRPESAPGPGPAEPTTGPGPVTVEPEPATAKPAAAKPAAPLLLDDMAAESARLKQLRSELAAVRQSCTNLGEENARLMAKVEVQKKNLERLNGELDGHVAEKLTLDARVAELEAALVASREREFKLSQEVADLGQEKVSLELRVDSLRRRSDAAPQADSRLENELSKTLDDWGVEPGDDLRVRLGYLRGFVAARGGLK